MTKIFQIIVLILPFLPQAQTDGLNRFSEDSIQTSEKSLTNLSLLAKTYENMGNYDRAISIYEKAISLNNELDDFKFKLSKLYVKKFRYNEAKKLLDELLTKNPKNASYFYERGLVSQKLKDSTSLSFYKKAYLINPNHIPSIQKLATYYILNEPKDSGLVFIENGLKVNNTNTVLINLKAQYLFFNRNYQSAIEYFEKLLKYGEDDDYIYEKLAEANNQLDNLDEALKYYKELGERNPKSPSIQYEIGVLYQNKQNKDSAIFYLEKALDLKEVTNVNEYFRLSELYTEKKDYEQAIFYLKAMLREKPDYYFGYYQVAFLADNYYTDPKLRMQYYKNFKKNVPEGVPMEEYLEYADKRISELSAEIHLKN
ncbi:tetratricopeptide repeat protein [Flavobacteriaceae bacterium M23B6Z8]